jgi:hypothetical protein
MEIIHAPTAKPILNHKTLHHVDAPCGYCQALANAKGERRIAGMAMAEGLRWTA